MPAHSLLLCYFGLTMAAAIAQTMKKDKWASDQGVFSFLPDDQSMAQGGPLWRPIGARFLLFFAFFTFCKPYGPPFYTSGAFFGLGLCQMFDGLNPLSPALTVGLRMSWGSYCTWCRTTVILNIFTNRRRSWWVGTKLMHWIPVTAWKRPFFRSGSGW